jgi:hypothetical protein
MNHITLIATCLALCTVSAKGADEVTYTILGVGSTSCGQWTKERQEQQGRLRGLQVLVKVSWMQGFVTALQGQTVSTGGPDITEGTDTGALIGWIDSFCEQYPLANIATASLKLVSELHQRKIAR